MTARLPELMAISDRVAGGGSLTGWLDALGRAGVGMVQLREKDLDDLALYDLARDAAARLPAGTLLLVNGRLDVALAAGADGVHLPSAGLPTAELRRRFGPEVLIGRSTHHPEEVEAAARGGADYVTFGPVYPTPSKAAYGPPPGLSGLREAAAVGLPVYALGGVTSERFEELAEAGADGAAAIRMFLDRAGLAAVVRRAREAFRARSEG